MVTSDRRITVAVILDLGPVFEAVGRLRHRRGAISRREPLCGWAAMARPVMRRGVDAWLHGGHFPANRSGVFDLLCAPQAVEKMIKIRKGSHMFTTVTRCPGPRAPQPGCERSRIQPASTTVVSLRS
jgi:hypothetical protein